MKKFFNSLKFSESGVRGVVGDGLTPALVCSLAAAFGQYVGRGRVVVGRDTRNSGEMLENAVIAGLLGVGCQVVDLGVVPTPTVQIMVGVLQYAGGIAITASHNPEPWNALKFIDRSGSFLDSGSAGELFDLYSQGVHEFMTEERLGRLSHFPDAFKVHEEKILSSAIDVERIRSRHFRVAVDAVNGVGAIYTADFLRNLGCEVFMINGEPDGRFSRNPEPVPEALGELAALVTEKSCALGFAQDPDGDRLTVVDDTGRILSPHLTVALAVEEILGASENPGCVVVNIQTSAAVAEIAKSYGGEVVYSKVGEINVVKAMKEHGAAVGGEGNCGGVIWREVHYGRDSFGAMALILSLLAVDDTPLSEMMRDLPNYVNLNMKYPATPLRSQEVLRTIARSYRDHDPLTFDGVRINFDDGWVLLRASNTEPVLRLNVECRSPEAARRLLDRFDVEIRELLEESEL